MTDLWGSKFMAIIFSLITHIENRYFEATGIHGFDPP